MNTKALRQKVLDLAIHGKLVPQNPNDESAEVLLKKIREEKAEKIKKGELKADKKDSFIFTKECEFDEDKLGKCSSGTRHKRHYEQFADGTVKDIEDEIPFDVPEGWTWCRLGEVCELKGGKRIPAGLSATKEKTNHIYIRVTDMQNNSISDADLVYITDEIFEKIQRYTINKDDLYLTIAGTIGRVGEVPEIFDGMNLTENALKLTNISICKKYLMQIINTKLVQDYFESTYHQVAMPKLSLINASKTIIPLPPLAEQERIVSVIKNIFSQIDTLDQNKSDLQTAIKQTKSKILDLAIHGKLVPQNPNDEPAEELLKRIATSDNRPYEKVEEEFDYEIPKNWRFCKVKDVCSVIMGQSPEGEAVSDDKNGMEFHQGKICFGKKYLEESSSFTKHITKIAPKDSVLLCVRAPVGIVNITEREICIGRGLCAVIPKYEINSDFWFYWLQSLQSDFEQKATGTTFRAISVDVIKNQFVAIPPHEEQNRIVNKINELYEQLDKIVLNLV